MCFLEFGVIAQSHPVKHYLLCLSGVSSRVWCTTASSASKFTCLFSQTNFVLTKYTIIVQLTKVHTL